MTRLRTIVSWQCSTQLHGAGAGEGRVLDVGCGDGRSRRGWPAPERGSPAWIPPPSRSSARAGRIPELELRPAPDGRLPFADACFDAVVCLQRARARGRHAVAAVRGPARAGPGRTARPFAVPWHGRLQERARRARPPSSATTTRSGRCCASTRPARCAAARRLRLRRSRSARSGRRPCWARRCSRRAGARRWPRTPAAARARRPALARLSLRASAC